jgi:putative ATPase
MTVATLEYVALPEGVNSLVEATLYLATAPKSNTANDYFKAFAKVEPEGKVQVPQHLQDGSRDAAPSATARTTFTPMSCPVTT